jgi:hypothetical protein
VNTYPDLETEEAGPGPNGGDEDNGGDDIGRSMSISRGSGGSGPSTSGGQLRGACEYSQLLSSCAGSLLGSRSIAVIVGDNKFRSQDDLDDEDSDDDGARLSWASQRAQAKKQFAVTMEYISTQEALQSDPRVADPVLKSWAAMLKFSKRREGRVNRTSGRTNGDSMYIR